MDPTASGSQEGPFKYVGVDDHYFAAVLLNDEPPRPVRIDYQPQHVPLVSDPSDHRQVRDARRCGSRRRR